MRRSLQIIGLALVCALPSAASGQSPRTTAIGFTGGASLPMGDLADGAESGFVVAGHFYLKPEGKTHFVYRGDVSYDRWGVKPTAGNNVVDGSFTSTGFVVNAMYLSGGEKAGKRPYVIGGLGFYRTNLKISGSGAGLSSESSDMGVQVGGGLEFKLSGISTFLEAKYVNVFRQPTSWTYVPITFGLHF